jgi:hypothetical protein
MNLKNVCYTARPIEHPKLCVKNTKFFKSKCLTTLLKHMTYNLVEYGTPKDIFDDNPIPGRSIAII